MQTDLPFPYKKVWYLEIDLEWSLKVLLSLGLDEI